MDDIDLWVGTLAEDPFNGGHVGELAFHVIVEQFKSLRNGDRYWYQGAKFSAQETTELESTTLADIIRRNTTIGVELSDNVFQVN